MYLTELGLHRKLSVVRPECGLRWNSEDCDINSLSCADASSCWITDYLNTAAPVLIETLSHNPPALQNRRRFLIWRCIWKVSFRIWKRWDFFSPQLRFPTYFSFVVFRIKQWWVWLPLMAVSKTHCGRPPHTAQAPAENDTKSIISPTLLFSQFLKLSFYTVVSAHEKCS